jgi:6-phosphogluconolactonase
MTPAGVAAEVVATFGQRVAAAFARQPRFAVAVPGGSVATAVFPRLAALDLDWSRLDLTWVDERVVPFTDRESNVGLTRELLMTPLGAKSPRAILPPVDAGDPARVAARWELALIDALGSPPRLDLAILGMGPDGHVASLFVNHAVVAVNDHWTAGVTDAPKPPPRRVTLTVPTFAQAAEIWIVAFGAEKAAAAAAARRDPASALPVAVVARAGPPVRWFLDDEAAGG